MSADVPPRVRQYRTRPPALPRLDRQALERELDALGIPSPNEPMCERCDTDVPAEGHTLCRDCRNEIDLVYGDLPGAEP